jgi:hypothetical protein
MTKLNWKDVNGWSVASTGFGGQYTIEPAGRYRGFNVSWSIPSGGFLHIERLLPATTLAEAQAAAQADYDEGGARRVPFLEEQTRAL